MDLMLIYEADQARKSFRRHSQLTRPETQFQENKVDASKSRKEFLSVLGTVLISVGRHLQAKS